MERTAHIWTDEAELVVRGASQRDRIAVDVVQVLLFGPRLLPRLRSARRLRPSAGRPAIPVPGYRTSALGGRRQAATERLPSC
jgi:hypothetical protein